MTSKQLITFLLILIGIGMLFAASKLLLNKPVDTIPTPVATSTPSTTNNGVVAAINTQVGMDGLSVKPLEILEDSRCPINVMCIQAGTVRLRADVTRNGQPATSQILTLNTPLSIGNQTITLTEVQPHKEAGVEVELRDYRFHFDIQ